VDLRERTSAMTGQLASLVEVESGSSDIDGIRACASAIEALALDLTAVKAERVEAADGRVHLVWRFGTSPTKVLLVGHFDTVWPAGTLARWPFTVDEAAGTATGPGAFDMKAGIVQMFHALSSLCDAGQSGLDGVTVVLNSDEELGSQTSRDLIEDLARPASAALVLEPSAEGGALKTARKGTSMYEVHVEGLAAHAGLEPEKGVNALTELAHQVLAVDTLGRPEVGTTVTPTVASAGTTTNTVPAEAVLHVDVRAESADEQQRVDDALRGLSPRVSGARLSVTGGINRAPLAKEASTELFRLAAAVASDLGIGELTGVAVGGGSDGNFTAGIGVPTLDGLGAVGGKAHGEGEWVHLPSMGQRAALVAELIRRIR
jgi:glutamate carboxypeptidase